MSKRGDNTRQRILQTSATLFAEKGFSAVTMKDICLASGLSRGGLYEHYTSVAEIFRALFSSLADPQSDFISQQIDAGVGAFEILDALFAVFDREMHSCEESLSLAIFEYAQSCDKLFLQNLHDKSVVRWERLLDYGISRGEFAPVDKQAFIELLLYSYQGVRICGKFLEGAQMPSRILPYLRAMLVPRD